MKRTMKKQISLLTLLCWLFAATASAQTITGGSGISSGNTPPATCSPPEIFFDTDATLGQNIYGCTSANTWTLQGDGTGSGTFGEASLAGLVNSQTLWDGANASRTFTFDLSAGDPVLTFSNGVMNLSTGAFQVGGAVVPTISSTSTLTNKTLAAADNVIGADTAVALAANGSNCSAGQFPLGVDASGAVESCTALPTTIAGTSNEIAASASTGAITLSIPATIDLGGKTSLEIPNAAAPTVSVFGEIAGDNNLWAASRGAPIFYDGTAATALVNVLVSDTPSNGQVPKWNTGGTITWEADSTGAGFGETSLSTLADPQVLFDSSDASQTLTFGLSGATDPVLTASDGTLNLSTGTLQQGGVAVALQGQDFCVDAGANDTYTCNLTPAPSAYTSGGHYRFQANTANTGAASINFNSIGAITIVKLQGAINTTLDDNDIRADQWVDLIYDGTNMQMVSPLGNAGAGAGDIEGVTAGAGLGGGGTSGTVTLTTASSEADFLASGALTCGAGTQGKMQVHTTPLQYCDNAATPLLRYAADANSSGVATSATALAANGANCSAGQAPLGVDASGAVESCTAYTTASTTDTFTNKTYDAEGSGNALTIPVKIWLPAAACTNATAGLMWDTPTSNAGAAACITGTNTQKGVIDFDAGTDESIQATIMLESDWTTGNLDVTFKWLAAATTGDVIWGIQTICVADAETDDPAFNTASTVTDTAKGTTNQTNDASITNVTKTGCAAGELMHIKIYRDADAGGDTMTGDARLIGAMLTYRRAM